MYVHKALAQGISFAVFLGHRLQIIRIIVCPKFRLSYPPPPAPHICLRSFARYQGPRHRSKSLPAFFFPDADGPAPGTPAHPHSELPHGATRMLLDYLHRSCLDFLRLLLRRFIRRPFHFCMPSFCLPLFLLPFSPLCPHHHPLFPFLPSCPFLNLIRLHLSWAHCRRRSR